MRRPVLGMVLLGAWAVSAYAGLVGDIRGAIAAKDFAWAEQRVRSYRQQSGVTPEMLEALSWLGRGALAEKRYEQATAYARETQKLSVDLLKRRALDADRHLPLALGAAIEVQAQALAAQGQLSEALALLDRELQTYRNTSIRTRIQKNINLLSLEGKPAPALSIGQWLGVKPRPLSALRGKPVLLFFWAHWCGDCKAEVPVLARLLQTYGPRGLVIVGPTQHYGYAAKGAEATAAEETQYIERVRRQYYSALGSMAVPLSERNFRNYGSSTTPTLVLLDPKGVVRFYHPGAATYEELATRVEMVLAN